MQHQGLFPFCPTCFYAQWKIQWTKAHKTGKEKNYGQNNQYNTQGSRDCTVIIQRYQSRGDRKPQDSVQITHVFLHDFKFTIYKWPDPLKERLM